MIMPVKVKREKKFGKRDVYEWVTEMFPLSYQNVRNINHNRINIYRIISI